MSQINVSVIVPVYNKEKYIGTCLDSILNQTLENIEIIIVDDGSTDNSLNVIERYANKYSNITFVSQENHGPGHARNEGLKIAKGEYVAFVDADDWIETESLKQLFDNADNHSSELVLFNAIEHLPEGKYRNRIYYPEDIEGTFTFKEKKDLLMNNFQIVCTKLHKLSFIKENNLRFSDEGLFEDVYFHIKSVIKARGISYVNKTFYNYRRTEANTRQLKSIRSRECFIFFEILDDIKKLLMEEKVYGEFETNFLQFKLTELSNLFNNINSNDKKDFYKILKEDFTYNSVSNETLTKLPADKQKFYLSIVDSKDMDDYYNLIKSQNKTQKSSRINKVFKRIKKIF